MIKEVASIELPVHESMVVREKQTYCQRIIKMGITFQEYP